jgi:hypothetical protein
VIGSKRNPQALKIIFEGSTEAAFLLHFQIVDFLKIDRENDFRTLFSA